MVAESDQSNASPSSSTALMAVPETLYDPARYPDSGATNYLTSRDANLMGKTTYNGDARIRMADGASVPIQHIGKSHFYSPNSIKPLFLNNLMHVPTISKNLLSASQFAKDNQVFFEFHPNVCYVKCQETKNILLEGKLRHGLYAFDNIQFPAHSKTNSACIFTNSCNNTVSVDSLTTWHARLGHPSPRVVSNVLKK